MLEEEELDLPEYDDETEEEKALRREIEVVLDEHSQKTVQMIVDKLMIACDQLSNHPLRPYQRPLGRRMFESFVLSDGARLTALFSRQSGKTECVADVVATAMIYLPVLAKVYPSLLGKYREGVWVGVFAPVDRQVNIIHGRIVSRLSSEAAKELLNDPEINDKVKGAGQTVRLQRLGSKVTRNTCHPTAKIEGDTFHIILIDECQDAHWQTVTKSVNPMGTSTRATHIWTGTCTYNKGIFYHQIQENKRAVLKKGRARQNHFDANWREVAKWVPDYKKAVYDEMRAMGADSDEFKLSYECVAPETRVLTADLQHIPAGEVTVGMKLLGFEEERAGKGLHRNFQEAEVTSAARIRRDSYRVVLDDGTEVTASAKHGWLVSTPGGRTLWKTTEQLTLTDRIVKITDVWDTVRSYEAGYLSAAFDGEGCLANNAGRSGGQLNFTQRDNGMLAQVQEFLGRLGYTYTTSDRGDGVHHLYLNGGQAAIMRFLGEMRPPRLLDVLDVNRLGSIGRHDHKRIDFRHPQVARLEYLGAREVVALETTSKTLITEGLASHNCMWILDKGQLITSEQFEELGDISVQSLEHTWFHSPVVAGIDCGKKQDKTIVTVCWVDWDHPDAFGFYEHRIIAWLDLEGLDWENQYFRIYEFLQGFKLYAVGVDTGGVGDVVMSRLKSLMPHINFVECLDSPGDQSRRFKYLKQLRERRRIFWPMGAKVRKLKVWRRFRQEMEDAELEYKGPNIAVAAPNAVGAHDDYVDSLAMAVWMTAHTGGQDAEDQQVVIYDSMFFRPSRRGW
jgi:hypothetical protein